MDIELICPSCGSKFASWVDEPEPYKTITIEGFCPYCGCGVRHVVRFVLQPIVIVSECTKTRLSERQRYQRL